MNLPTEAINEENHSGSKAEQLAIDDSELNFSDHYSGLYCISGKATSLNMLPVAGFNSVVAREFISDEPSQNLGNVLVEAKKAPHESYKLGIQDLRRYHIMPSLLAAISTNYLMHVDQLAHLPKQPQKEALPASPGCG